MLARKSRVLTGPRQQLSRIQPSRSTRGAVGWCPTTRAADKDLLGGGTAPTPFGELDTGAAIINARCKRSVETSATELAITDPRRRLLSDRTNALGVHRLVSVSVASRVALCLRERIDVRSAVDLSRCSCRSLHGQPTRLRAETPRPSASRSPGVRRGRLPRAQGSAADCQARASLGQSLVLDRRVTAQCHQDKFTETDVKIRLKVFGDMPARPERGPPLDDV